MHIKRKAAIVAISGTFIISSYLQPVLAQTQGVSPALKPSPSLAKSPSPTPTLTVQEPTTGIQLTVSPVYINITTNPGTPISTSFKVTNNNNVKEFFQLSLIKFKADSTGANISPSDVDSSDEFVKWIKFSEDQFELGSNETKKIDFTISPPNNAALGYYYGIRVGRIKEMTPGKQQSVITGSAVVSLLMEVRSPNAKKELSVLDFTTSEPFYEYLPAQFKIKVRNSGNVHSVPFGDIFIDQGNKKEISVIQTNQERSNVLPQTERTFLVDWKDGFPERVPKMKNNTAVLDKNGKTVYETKWDLSKIANFRIGKYTANLVMVYDDGKQDVPLNATVSFWVIPWKILLGLLVIVILILFGLKSIISSLFRKK